MANLSITMSNEKRIMKAWKAAPKEMGKAIASAIQRAGVYMSGQVKEYIRSGTDMWKAPLDTGRLMGGIHPVFDGSKAYIKPSTITPYAEFVHEGTGRMQARPFFDIASNREAQNVGKMAMEVIEKTLKQLKI